MSSEIKGEKGQEKATLAFGNFAPATLGRYHGIPDPQCWRGLYKSRGLTLLPLLLSPLQYPIASYLSSVIIDSHGIETYRTRGLTDS